MSTMEADAVMTGSNPASRRARVGGNDHREGCPGSFPWQCERGG